LDNEETEQLFRTIRQLKENGVSVVYISHRMEEIFSICDRVSVFRDGQFIDCKPINEVTEQSLISMMVGREVKNVFPKTECEIGDVVFKVEGLTGKGFQDISFEVRAGEILGLTGLAGAGRSETMRAIFGLDPLESGKMYLEGKEIVNNSPKQAIRNGIAMVNEDRRKYGLCLYRSISENISLPNLPAQQKGLLLNKRKEKKENAKYAQMLTVKAASLEEDAIALSGGNQQKVVLAKWLMTNPKVLILDEPTRGVDVGAKSEIHSLMCSFAKQGLAVIMISSELPEVMAMSDRLLVYHEGKINGELFREDILSGRVTQETVLAKEFGN
jgi:ribose transport system ATP-binding protein/inositol transport system ATP-binding protein